MRYIERMAPKAALLDQYGALRAMTFERQKVDASTGSQKWSASGEIIELPARTVCVAAGTSPNTIYEKEHPGTFVLGKGGYFAPHRVDFVDDGNGGTRPQPVIALLKKPMNTRPRYGTADNIPDAAIKRHGDRANTMSDYALWQYSEQ